MISINPFISIIIPSYNRGEFISRAVHSVLCQTFNNVEILVVDDGSTDDTLQQLQQLQGKDPRLKIIQHENNLGAQAARNTGIRAAMAPYIAFLDSDDEWLPNKLERQISLIESSNNNVGVVYAGFLWVHADGRPTKQQAPRFRGKIYRNALKEWIADTNTFMVRKDILYKAGLLDENIRSYQEWDLCIKLARYTEFDFVDEPLAIYHIHDKPAISKDLLLDALGYLDVITVHRDEILTELGNNAFARHLLSASLRFANANDFKTAKNLTAEAIKLSHKNQKCLILMVWFLFQLGSRPYKAITAAFLKIRSFYQSLQS
jgi:glycosyltransferase involved in cell wall biosynthesis